MNKTPGQTAYENSIGRLVVPWERTDAKRKARWERIAQAVLAQHGHSRWIHRSERIPTKKDENNIGYIQASDGICESKYVSAEEFVKDESLDFWVVLPDEPANLPGSIK